MALTRDKILESKGRLKTEPVHVPEWADGDDDIVIVRELTGSERDAFEASLTVQRPKIGAERGGPSGEMESVPNLGNLTARFVALVAVDEQGKPLFTPADAIELGELSASALNRVYKVGSRLSAMQDNADADAEGDSDAGPAGDSTSDSHESAA